MNNNHFDILEGKINLNHGIIFDVNIKIQYEKINPYYWRKHRGYIEKTESKEIAQEWKNKRSRVFYCDNNYTYELYWENVDNQGKKFFWRDREHKIIITNEIKEKINNMLNKLNNKGVLIKSAII